MTRYDYDNDSVVVIVGSGAGGGTLAYELTRQDVPVVLLTAQTGTERTAAGFEAGVTDYLTKPFSPPHVRSRVRAWLLRRPPATADGP